MVRLTEQQIDQIFSELGSLGIVNGDLKQEILDHICCILERDLVDETDFETMYKSILKTFYKRHLSEIEQEIRLLQTFKNYHNMKKVMIISGVFSVVAMLAGIWFKLMHYPGAGVLLPIGIFSGSFLFLPLLFILKAKEQRGVRETALTITAAVSVIMLLIGVGLKIVFNQPGSAVYPVMFYASMGLMLGVFLPVYFFTGIRNPETKFNTMVTSLIVVMVYALLFSMSYQSL